jgi:hypothetical protein
MQWSQLKKRIEDTFAESLQGRMQVWSTRYRRAHDQVGESWLTFDKERIDSMGTQGYDNQYFRIAHELRTERDCLDYNDPAQRSGYYNAYQESEKLLHDKGVFPSWEFNRALFDYLNLSIDEAISSENPIQRALALLDKRFGKRRLQEFNPSSEHPFVAQLYSLRCKAEHIPPSS